MVDKKEYFFKKDADKLVLELSAIIKNHENLVMSSGVVEKWRKAYNAYYGNYYQNMGGGLGISGEAGQLTEMSVNHLRNIVKHIYNLSSQNRLVFDSLALNSDVKSRNDSIVANAVVDYYFYDKNFEKDCKLALEMALVFGTSYLYVSWEPNKDIFGIDGDEEIVYKGAPQMQAIDPGRLILENPTLENFSRQNWVIVEEIHSKHDLAAIYTDKKDEIEDLPCLKDYGSLGFFNSSRYVDSVKIYKVFHKPTPALPKGRFLVISADNNVVLLDKDENPYGCLPVFELKPDTRFGTAYGHSPLLDLLPAQEAHNSLMSSIITNQRAYATQNICIPKQSDINVSELAGNLNILTYTADSELPRGGQPEALQLCATPNEVFAFQKELISQMEQVSGINSAARGMPPASATSGTAIALIAASAQSFNSTVESSYLILCEKAASFLIDILKKFMQDEELIAISGSSNSYAVKSFKGEDLENIRRVRIVSGNAMSKTLSGKVSMADTLLASQQINPQQYLEVLQTGTLSRTIEDKTLEEAFVKQKMELISQGTPVPALIYDNHPIFISAIKLLTMRPDIRLNNQVLEVVLSSMQEHVDMLAQLTTMAGQDPVGGMKLAIALNQPISVQPSPPQQAPQAPQGGAQMSGEPKPDQNSTNVEASAASGQMRADKEAAMAEQEIAAQ